MPKKLTKEEVIRRIKEKRPGCKIGEFEYVNSKVKNIPIICEWGHEFVTRWNDIDQGYWCTKCGREKVKEKLRLKLSYSDIFKYIKKLHPNCKIERFKYIDVKTKNIPIICERGHFFITSLGYIKSGNWCQRCARKIVANKNKFSHEYVIKKIKNLHPNCTIGKFKYIGSMVKNIPIICEKGHKFMASHISIQSGYWCPKCARIISNPEKEVVKFLKENIDLEVVENKKFNFKKFNDLLFKQIYFFELDICIPKLKLGIEFDGMYWHSEEYLVKNKTENHNWPKWMARSYHEIKDYMFEKYYGIKVYHIKEEDWMKDKESELDKLLKVIEYKKRRGIAPSS